MNIFLFLSLIFLLVFLLGRVIEKARVPWVFAALILGAVLAIYNPFYNLTSSDTFLFLAQLGMYFLLFVIGLEIDLKKLKEQSKFILKSSFFIIFCEALFGTIIIYFLLHYSLTISVLVALSFATVGEAILIPILDEFKLVNTKLGQSIIGIGTIDDLLELLLLVLVIFLIGANGIEINLWLVLVLLFVLFAFTFGLRKLKNEGKRFKFLPIEMLFLFALFLFFFFLGVGNMAHAAPIAALLAGVALKTFLPKKRLDYIESEIKTMCYGFFAPLFFLWAGLEMNMKYLFRSPALIILIVLVASAAKIFGSLIAGRKELGVKKSVLLGIGLSVRFSTGIVIIKILLDNNIINSDLYSVLIASSIILGFIIPFLFSKLLLKWKIVNESV
ncbi:cation:proton antiporter [bacterium]|nr:cation:proton antiporter [bacterium]